MAENRIAAAVREAAGSPPVIVIDEPGAPVGLKPDSPVGFVLFPNEVVPAVIAQLRDNERIDCKATIVIPERRPNPDPFAMNRFAVVYVESQRLQQRVRKFDPPIQRDEMNRLESFTLVHAAGEPGGPLTAGTWFDLTPWIVSLVCTKYEQKDQRGVVTVAGEVKDFGPWPGVEYALAFRELDAQRRMVWWDRIEARFALAGTQM